MYAGRLPMPLKPAPATLQPLQEVRIARRMTQHELARVLHCDQQTVSRLEVGFMPPTRRQLAVLCKCFNAKPEALFKIEVLREVQRRVRTPIDAS